MRLHQNKLCYNLLYYEQFLCRQSGSVLTCTFPPSSHFNWKQSMRPVDRRSEMVCNMLTKVILRGMHDLLYNIHQTIKHNALEACALCAALRFLFYLIQNRNQGCSSWNQLQQLSSLDSDVVGNKGGQTVTFSY